MTSDYEQLCRILVAAFSNNDFDAFELRPNELPLYGPDVRGFKIVNSRNGDGCFRWKKTASHLDEIRNAWSLNIDLVTGNSRTVGSMTVYRLYSPRPLQIDVNLLTADFPTVLAESLERSLLQNLDVAVGQAQNKLRAAQVG
jgi:hypothetical protein